MSTLNIQFHDKTIPKISLKYLFFLAVLRDLKTTSNSNTELSTMKRSLQIH